MSNPPSWADLAARSLQVAKIKAREGQQALQGIGNAVQSNPKLATVAKTAGAAGKVAKFGVPVVGAAIDFGLGLAEGEDPVRAGAGAGGSLAGGAAGAWAGAGIGTAIFPGVGTAIGGVTGAIGGGLLGGAAGDQADKAIRGSQPIDLKRQQQAGIQPTGSNASTSSYAPIKGRFQVDPNATYRYQPMQTDGSGGIVLSGNAPPVQPTATQPTRNGRLQPTSFNQGGNGRPNTVSTGGTEYLQGFAPNGSNGGFQESAAPGARQYAAPNQDGQLVQAGFNPFPAISKGVSKVAPGVTTPVSSAAGVAGVLGPTNIAKTFVQKGLESLILPAVGVLVGGYYAPKVAAGVAAVNAPGAMGRYSLPSQPSWWDQTLFGGAINRTFGNPGGLEFQKNQADNATKRRGQDVQQSTAMRGQDVQTYKTDVGAETTRRGQDLRIQGQDIVSKRQFQGKELQYGQGGSVDRTNATNLQRTGMQYGQGGSVDRTNATNLQREAIKGTFGNQRETIKGQFGNQRETIKGQFGNQRETIKGTFGNQRETIKGQFGNQREGIKGEYKIADTKEANKGKLQVADINSGRRLQGQVYTADQRLAGTTYTADRRVDQEGIRQSGAVNVAGIRAGGQVAAAGANAESRVEAARLTGDSRVRVADVSGAYKLRSTEVQASSKAESEGSKAAASFVANLNKSTTDSVAAEEKARIARFKALGVY